MKFTNEDLDKALEELIEKGLLDYTVDERGEFLFKLTPLGESTEITIRNQENES